MRSALVYKLFFFQFVNCYFLLFYIGFAKPLSGHLFGVEDTCHRGLTGIGEFSDEEDERGAHSET